VVDARGTPDLVPVLAVCAAVSPGVTEFVNAGRLRIKESDRLESTAAMLRALGAEVEVRPEGLAVRGREWLTGGVVDSANDHRIAMSAAVASTVCRGAVTVLGAQCVEKSYPAFWEDFQFLGGLVRREED
ncbi:MAG: 3-phosphoshikimate 1-carboxyvinyltransferase, partial [Butyricicoccus sp.]|nr:3-phosphoshikimate 1-carboxyvinyltransferase [Butyricicoccus sp.]